MRLNFREIASRLNSSYWFVPLVVTLAGAGLALLLLFLDQRISMSPRGALGLLRPSSPEGSRALLSALITSMITAVSVTFSVTIVALTVAAQHFGPRVLNNFIRHTSAQVVLGTFMATFTYSVLVLGAVRGEGERADIPEMAVAGAVVLVIVSIGALIYYVHHVSTSLQIGTIAAAIAADFRGTMERFLEETRPAPGAATGDVPDAPGDAAEIPSVEGGYVQRIDYGAVAKLAAERDAVIWFRREPGAFIVSGTPLALVHPPAACDDELPARVRHACIVGRDRTLWQDPEFAVKQLVEVALRALSPGVNEPFTAMTCLDRLTEGLAWAASAPEPQSAWRDGSGRPRVYVRPQRFETLLRASFDPIRIFAGANPAIYARLLDNIGELALVAARGADREALRRQAALVRRAAAHSLAEAEDRAFVEARYDLAERQFGGDVAATRG